MFHDMFVYQSRLGRVQGIINPERPRKLRYVLDYDSRYVCTWTVFTICFTICLFISPDLDGHRAPKMKYCPTETHKRSLNPNTKPPELFRAFRALRAFGYLEISKHSAISFIRLSARTFLQMQNATVIQDLWPSFSIHQDFVEVVGLHFCLEMEYEAFSFV